MSKKADKKDIKKNVKSNEKFDLYRSKQLELITYMKEIGFDTNTVGAPQRFISIVSQRDPDTTHEQAVDKLTFVEDYLKNNLDDAKKEFEEVVKEVKEKKSQPRAHKNHRCNCRFCTHKPLTKPHQCTCEYCPLKNTQEDESGAEPVAKTDEEPKVKKTTKPKTTKPKAPPKPRTSAKKKTKPETTDEEEDS